MGKIWTEKEIIFLNENYILKGLEYCSKLLNRSHNSIMSKVKIIKIKKLNVLDDFLLKSINKHGKNMTIH